MTHDQIRHFFATMDTDAKVHFFNEYATDMHSLYFPLILSPSDLLADMWAKMKDAVRFAQIIQRAGDDFDADEDWAYLTDDWELGSFNNGDEQDWLDDICVETYKCIPDNDRLEFHEYLATH